MNKWLNWKPECSNSKLVEMEKDELSENEAKCFEIIENQSVYCGIYAEFQIFKKFLTTHMWHF